MPLRDLDDQKQETSSYKPPLFQSLEKA